MRRRDGDKAFGGRKRQQLLYGGWHFVDDGQDWIMIVTLPAQVDDGCSLSPKGWYDRPSIWWRSGAACQLLRR